jgi:alpha-L-fucosidase
MLARFQSDVVNLSPKKVVILAGTNDIAMNKGYMSLDHIFENIVSMVQIAKANKIKVVLCSVLPAEKFRWSWEISTEEAVKSIRELNARIEEYAKANGIKFADYYSVMDDGKGGLKKEYQRDAVHPNLEGYYVMEEVIQKILK